VFVTAWRGVGFHRAGPGMTQARGPFSGNPHHVPARGPPPLIPRMVPHLLPHISNGDTSGVWVGLRPERAQGQGMPK